MTTPRSWVGEPSRRTLGIATDDSGNIGVAQRGWVEVGGDPSQLARQARCVLLRKAKRRLTFLRWESNPQFRVKSASDGLSAYVLCWRSASQYQGFRADPASIRVL